MLKQDLTVYDPYPEGIESTAIYANKVGQTYFEINNYLGNVNAVMTDRKSANLTPSSSNASTWEAVVMNTSDYYPFGMVMPGRVNSYGAGVEYRYAYNGKETDNEVSGNGNSYTTEFRQYDPRLARWKSLDPLMHKFPWQSPYVAFNNNPVYFTDILGLEGVPPANVLILIFGQDEIDFRLINSEELMGEFHIIIANNMNDAAIQLENLLSDGQCVDNLMISAHGGLIKTSSGDYMNFYINPNQDDKKLDRGVDAQEIYLYCKKPEQLEKSQFNLIKSLEKVISSVSDNGTVVYLSCNLADDENLMLSLSNVDGQNNRTYYFNGDKCVYNYQTESCSFVLDISKPTSDEIEKGWFTRGSSGESRSLKNSGDCKTGGIRLDPNLNNNKFVTIENDPTCSGNEMEDNQEKK